MSLSSAAKKSAVQLAMAAERLTRGRPAAGTDELTRVRSFLFLNYMQPLGYCVHDTPIYEALRAAKPDAHITVATRGSGFQTLRHNPYINALISTADPFTDLRGAAREVRRDLGKRGLRPETGITNCSNPRTRITLLNVLAGPHLRLGHTLAPGLYHRPLTYDRTRSLIDNNLELLTHYGCPRTHYEPKVFFREQDAAAVRRLLTDAGVTPEPPLVVFVTQTSGGQRTGWFTHRFAQVIAYVHRTLGCQVAFVGTAADALRIEELRAEAAATKPPARALGTHPERSAANVSLAGKTSIAELSALLCHADYVVSLDTGTMHMGRAAGTPMVVLGPSWQKPLEWLPLGNPRVRILRGEDVDHAPEGYQLDEVEVAPVLQAIDELKSLYPRSPLEREARVRASLSAVDHAEA